MQITEPVFKTKKTQERVDSMNQLFVTVIHKHSFEGLGTDTLTSCELTPFLSLSQIFWTLTCAKSRCTLLFFIVAISIQNRRFLKNPWKPVPFHEYRTAHIYGMSRLFESPRKKVDSVVAPRIFSPNYFEYRLWFPTAWLYSPGGSTISWLDSCR